MDGKEIIKFITDYDFPDPLIKIAGKIINRERISSEEARRLIEEGELPFLGLLANYIREYIHGSKTFFNRTAPASYAELYLSNEPFCFYYCSSDEDLYQNFSIESIKDNLKTVRDFSDSALNKWVSHQGIYSNAAMSFHQERSFSNHIDHLQKLRELQDQTRAFKTFVPIKPAILDKEMTERQEMSIILDLMHYSLSRIFLDNIPHITLCWPVIGKETARISLNFGVDDLEACTYDYPTKAKPEKNHDAYKPGAVNPEQQPGFSEDENQFIDNQSSINSDYSIALNTGKKNPQEDGQTDHQKPGQPDPLNPGQPASQNREQSTPMNPEQLNRQDSGHPDNQDWAQWAHQNAGQHKHQDSGHYPGNPAGHHIPGDDLNRMYEEIVPLIKSARRVPVERDADFQEINPGAF